MDPTPISTTTHADAAPDDRAPLDAIFRPRSLAVIGATDREGTIGRTVVDNTLRSTFGGPVYLVNASRDSVAGRPAYRSIADVPPPVDLALIAVRAELTPDIVRQCGKAGVRGVIIIAAGFKETGPEGAALERRVFEEARRGGVRVIGPNCVGVMNPVFGLNATFVKAMALPGTVAFISQSGALCTAILDWSLQEKVGFSAFVSLGSMADVGWGEVIHYFGDDRNTKSIILYMESVDNPRTFLSAAREVSYVKPIIVLKAGRTAPAQRAASSHTGALAGSDEVLDAAFRRCGVLRVNTVEELFHMAEALAKQPRPRGNRLTIVGNAGGPAVLATDALIIEGGELASLGPDTMDELNHFLPPHWSRGNPIDILGDADADRYAKAVEIVLRDPNADAVLAILAPQAEARPLETARKFVEVARGARKPVLASWMGAEDVAVAKKVLAEAAIPTFDYPEIAAQVFNYMWKYDRNMRALYETPSLPADDGPDAPDRDAVTRAIDEALEHGHTLLAEHESKELLRAYGIPVNPSRFAANEDDAVHAANELGYLVVLKIHSHTVIHKASAGGVELNLPDEAAVRAAYRRLAAAFEAANFEGVSVQPMAKPGGVELILGSATDSQFGPVILFGAGGRFVEVFGDRAVGLPPLNATLAMRLIERTRVVKALRYLGVDLDAVCLLLIRLGHLIIEQRRVKEIDINPLLASRDGLLALDARVVLHPKEVPLDQLPPLAIRPYPTQYVQSWTTRKGLEVLIRPIRPEDEALMIDFHKSLSSQSVYFRFFGPVALDQRIAHERLCRMCFIDYEQEIGLVVVYEDPKTARRRILGVARIHKVHATPDVQFAVAVSDAYHRQGIGSRLLRAVLDVARAEGARRVIGHILPDNRPMIEACKKIGFEEHYLREDRVVEAVYEFARSPA